jgi:hypothetical protein
MRSARTIDISIQRSVLDSASNWASNSGASCNASVPTCCATRTKVFGVPFCEQGAPTVLGVPRGWSAPESGAEDVSLTVFTHSSEITLASDVGLVWAVS